MIVPAVVTNAEAAVTIAEAVVRLNLRTSLAILGFF
jgi:hypothetical protein